MPSGGYACIFLQIQATDQVFPDMTQFHPWPRHYGNCLTKFHDDWLKNVPYSL